MHDLRKAMLEADKKLAKNLHIDVSNLHENILKILYLRNEARKILRKKNKKFILLEET